MMKSTCLWFILLMIVVDRHQAAVFVSIAPERSQFFKYDHFTVSCEEEEEEAPGWSLMQKMKDGEVKPLPSPFSVSAAFPHEHSGVYWCQSGPGANSSLVFITVTAGSVILDSPVLPVTEGHNVTLSCRCKGSAAADVSCAQAEFYRDGVRIGTRTTGNMTVHNLSGSDQGFYKCQVHGSGESPESWLAVREQPSPSAPVLPVSILVRPLMVGSLYLLSTIILCLVISNRRKHQRAVQAGQRRTRDVVLMQIIT